LAPVRNAWNDPVGAIGIDFSCVVRQNGGRMLDRTEFTSRFGEFVSGVDEERSIATLGPDDNLFDAGVLDSFTVVKVIVFLEHLVGRPVDLQEASIESFASLNSIYDNFVKQ
jgi:acyl carrier protein